MTNSPPIIAAQARKALGQHFLFDPDILQRCAFAAGKVEGRTVIEIGPGPGGLTRAILDGGAAKLICVEADERFAETLSRWPEVKTGRLHIQQGDARKVDLPGLIAQIGGDTPAMIIANLPYNVGTPLLVNWLKAGDWRGEMALMFQKEVALRICAEPGTPHYGRLAVLTRAVCFADIAFTLPPGAFSPPPKVDSAVAVLHPKPIDKRFKYLDALEIITAAAFGQRRKMVRSALKSVAKQRGIKAEEWLTHLGIDPAARAEVLPQSAFEALAEDFATFKTDKG